MDYTARFYLIPKHLDKGMMLCGLPISEALPALVCLSVGLSLRVAFWGVCLGAGWIASLRILKQIHGDQGVAGWIYGRLPAGIVAICLKRTPAANKRHWLA
jgi:type IV conjugative transfer system protein TraL